MPVDFADGNPIANLELIRSIFFAIPGYSLGGRKKQVLSQAFSDDQAHPTDRNYVENVMWEQSRVLFVTINVPGGSNNDSDNWFGQARTRPKPTRSRSARRRTWIGSTPRLRRRRRTASKPS